jgi:hypothetical protein
MTGVKLWSLEPMLKGKIVCCIHRARKTSGVAPTRSTWHAVKSLAVMLRIGCRRNASSRRISPRRVANNDVGGPDEGNHHQTHEARVASVTGTSQGIEKAIAVALAARGARVIATNLFKKRASASHSDRARPSGPQIIERRLQAYGR